MVKDRLFLFRRVVVFLCLVYGLVSVAVVFLNLCLHANPTTEIESCAKSSSTFLPLVSTAEDDDENPLACCLNSNVTVSERQ